MAYPVFSQNYSGATIKKCFPSSRPAWIMLSIETPKLSCHDCNLNNISMSGVTTTLKSQCNSRAETPAGQAPEASSYAEHNI
jgi:hypothetical protein